MLDSYAYTKKIAILLFSAFAMSSVMAEDTTNVTAVIKGKSVEFSPEVRAQVVQKSVDLLSSCIHMNSKPKWGTGTQPQSIADAQKESHLRLVFSSARKVQVPAEKVTIQVREMVITLPLNTGGIWVRTENRVIYFAKFSHTTVEELQALLKGAEAP
jgi:hypothetical protein